MENGETPSTGSIVKAEHLETPLPKDVPIPQSAEEAPPSQSRPSQEANPFQEVLDERIATNKELQSLAEEAEKHKEDKQKVCFRILQLEEELDEGSVARERNEFFDAMLASVQEEPETRETLHERLALLKSSKFKTRLTRLLIYQSAVDYSNGTSAYFSELKEQTGPGELKKEIEALREKVSELESLIELKEKQRGDLMTLIYAQVKAEEEEHAAELERQRLADEEEAREAEAMKELERMRLEQEALLRLEEEAQRAVQQETDRLTNTGYSASMPYVVGEAPLDGVDATYQIKSERVDHIADLIEEFKTNDRAGRRAIRSERAARRADRAARRAKGQNTSDEEWVEELDGKFDDDSEEETTTSTQTSLSTSTEKASLPPRPNTNQQIFSWGPPQTSPSVPSKRSVASPEHTGPQGSTNKRGMPFAQYKEQHPPPHSDSSYPSNRTYRPQSQSSSNRDPRRLPSAYNGDPRRAGASDPRRRA